jgi:hypothetical protein
MSTYSPQPGEIAVASAAVSGLFSLGIWGFRSRMGSGLPLPRPVVEALYGGISSYGSTLITPSVLPLLPKVPIGEDETGKVVAAIDNNGLQVLVPPSISGMIHVGLLYGINGEKDKWDMLRNFLTGFFSQTAGYYAADVYENWNSPL